MGRQLHGGAVRGVRQVLRLQLLLLREGRARERRAGAGTPRTPQTPPGGPACGVAGGRLLMGHNADTGFMLPTLGSSLAPTSGQFLSD